jgi:hypothetical protein
MQAISDLFKSERGLLGLLLIVGATILAVVGKMTVDAWSTFAMVIFGTYAAGKTISSAAASIAESRKNPALDELGAELKPLIIEMIKGIANPQARPYPFPDLVSVPSPVNTPFGTGTITVPVIPPVKP